MRSTVCVVYTHAAAREMDSPLHTACINGDVSSLAGMLSAVSSRSANDPDTVLGWCPLHFAARFGRQQVVELLLDPPVRTPSPRAPRIGPHVRRSWALLNPVRAAVSVGVRLYASSC
eukprot:COSAG02_NODE_6124_length_3784_cov_1.813297_3_plen_117_part_00